MIVKGLGLKVHNRYVCARSFNSEVHAILTWNLDFLWYMCTQKLVLQEAVDKEQADCFTALFKESSDWGQPILLQRGRKEQSRL